MNKKPVVGVIAKPKVNQAIELADKVVAWLKDRSIEYKIGDLITDSFLPKGEDESNFVSRQDMSEVCDVIVVLGGDGTFISVARYPSDPPPKIIGVNMGTLGFLTEITTDELFPILEKALEGKAETEQRSILEASLVRNGKVVETYNAVNDIVITKQAIARIFGIHISVDDESAALLRGDGVIVSSPAGSTAYSLSAGGSIVMPSVNATLISPICPHSLTSRPLVVPGDSKVCLGIPEGSRVELGDIYLTVDGQQGIEMGAGDEVRITKSEKVIELVKSPSKTYFEVLGAKLHWAELTVPKGDA